MPRKTRKMLEVERRQGAPPEAALPALLTERGLSGAAAVLGVSKATLGYWLLKLDIRVRRVATAPGDDLTTEEALRREVEILRRRLREVEGLLEVFIRAALSAPAGPALDGDVVRRAIKLVRDG